MATKLETQIIVPEKPRSLMEAIAESRASRVLIPVVVGLCFLGLWEFLVWELEIRKFVLPAPSLIITTLFEGFWSYIDSFWFTFKITVAAFVLAVVSGISIAVAFTQNKLIERAFFPYAVMLQVTPVVSIAPLVIIWVGFDNVALALLILAWIVAFFPILSNTVLGLNSTDHNLRNLFELYGASRWQIFVRLQFPTALPFLLGGMRISGGLALIGAVVAEFVAGSGAETGLAWRIIESGNRLNIPGMFAALILLSVTGITIFFCLTGLQHMLLRKWHESATKREN